MSSFSPQSGGSCASSPSLVHTSRRSSMTSPSEVSESSSPPEPASDNIIVGGQGNRGVCRAICFVGGGYVGGPTAAVIALHNPSVRVVVVDKDADRIAKWKSRHLPVHEPGLYDLVRTVRDGTTTTAAVWDGATEALTTVHARAPNLFFSTDIDGNIAQADIIFLSVNTNTKTSGVGAGQATNMAALESATQAIARWAKAGAIIVEKSTVPCRTAQSVQDTIKSQRPGVHFEILSNPEFLSQGTAVQDLMQPDRILIGSVATASGRAAADTLGSIYTTWVDPARVMKTDLWSSELAKLVANAMLAQRISSINTISAVCEKIGANVDQVAKAVGLDNRVGSRFLKAGIGFGGSCFQKDILSLIYLANSLGLPEVADYWTQVLTINDFQRRRFVSGIVGKLSGSLSRSKIAILGYAFKKGTNDTRGAPAIDVVQQLLANSASEIAIFDPDCGPRTVHSEIERCCGKEVLKSEGGSVNAHVDVYSALNGASAAVILTDCDQFRYPPPATVESAIRDGDQRTSSERHVPKLSDMKLLALRERKQQMEQVSNQARRDSDPTDGFANEPSCPVGCPECARAQTEEVVGDESLNWTQVASMMKQPKWVFDGRGVVDVLGMEKLGFRVVSIGRTSSAGRLNDTEEDPCLAL